MAALKIENEKNCKIWKFELKFDLASATPDGSRTYVKIGSSSSNREKWQHCFGVLLLLFQQLNEPSKTTVKKAFALNVLRPSDQWCNHSRSGSLLMTIACTQKRTWKWLKKLRPSSLITRLPRPDERLCRCRRRCRKGVARRAGSGKASFNHEFVIVSRSAAEAFMAYIHRAFFSLTSRAKKKENETNKAIEISHCSKEILPSSFYGFLNSAAAASSCFIGPDFLLAVLASVPGCNFKSLPSLSNC